MTNSSANPTDSPASWCGHGDVPAQQGDPAELGEQQRARGEVADRGGQLQGVAELVGGQPVVAEPECISAGGAEQLTEQLVVADPPGDDPGPVEQLAGDVLLSPAAGGDGEAAERAGDGALVPGPLGARQRLLPQRCDSSSRERPERDQPGPGQRAGQGQVVGGGDRPGAPR